MESEERRALVLLGITAVLASFLATMYALIWTGMKNENDFYFNVPCTSVPHLTVIDVNLLQPIITAWVTYAFFAFFYFAEDWFPGRRGTIFRNFCHFFAALSMGYYFLFAVWFIPVAYILIVFIPPQFGALYLLLAFLGLSYIEIRFVEMAIGRRGIYNQLSRRFLRRTGGPIFTAAKPHLTKLIAQVWSRHNRKLPPTLRDQLISLRRSIHTIRENRRLRGRISLYVALLGIVAILMVTVYFLYRRYCGGGILPPYF